MLVTTVGASILESQSLISQLKRASSRRQKEQGTKKKKKGSSRVNRNRWVCEEIIKQNVRQSSPRPLVAPVLPEELTQRSPISRWTAELSKRTLLNIRGNVDNSWICD